MSAFKPTQVLTDADGGASSFRLVEVRADSAFSGDNTNLPSRVKFNYRGSGNTYINPAESFFALRVLVTDNGGAALIAGDNLGLAQFAPAHMWSSVVTYLGGAVVEELTNPSQQTVIQNLATRSSAWQETAGSIQMGQLAFADRQPLTYALNTPELIYRPSSGFWSTEKLIRGASVQVDFNVHPDWARRIISSTGADKTPGALGDYIPNIQDYRLYVAEYQAENEAAPDVDVIETHTVEIQSASLSALTSSSTTFGLSAPAYKAFAVLQLNTAGTSTTVPLNQFSSGTLTNVTLDYAGQRMPQYQYELAFATARTQRAFADFLASAFADIDPSGASVDEETWRTLQPVFAWKLVTKAGSRPDRIVVNTTHSAAFTGVIYLATVHLRRIVAHYDDSGMIRDVRVARSDSDLESAVRE